MTKPQATQLNPTSTERDNKLKTETDITTLKELQSLSEQQRIEIEAAVFRRLVAHLQKRSDVQNIDVMNLAGFCRNCLSKWYRQEAEAHQLEIADLVAREHIYGMPYGEWKEKYQK